MMTFCRAFSRTFCRCWAVLTGADEGGGVLVLWLELRGRRAGWVDGGGRCADGGSRREDEAGLWEELRTGLKFATAVLSCWSMASWSISVSKSASSYAPPDER